MFKFIKKNKADVVSHDSTAEPIHTRAVAEKPKGLLGALSQGLRRTRDHFTSKVTNLFLGEKIVDAALLDEIETQLLAADISLPATRQILNEMTQRVKHKELTNSAALLTALQQALINLLAPYQTPWTIPQQNKPYVIMMVGVNGAGKTTTIGKLAKRLQAEGKSVLLAAGDTFRAAAIEQLKIWGERNHIPVITQHSGADSASVIYDALSSATARNIDILIADTAGRLHTQTNLMEELKKIKRVLAKINPEAPHETILVLDAGIGQNALKQAQQFNKAIQLNSMIITKLDGTAKGGMVFSLSEQLHLPIRFIGVGESIEDLQPFEATRFVDALLERSDMPILSE